MLSNEEIFCLHSHSIKKLNYVDILCCKGKFVDYLNIKSKVTSPSLSKRRKKTHPVDKLKGFYGEKWKVRFYILLCFNVETFIVMVSRTALIFL